MSKKFFFVIRIFVILLSVLLTSSCSFSEKSYYVINSNSIDNIDFNLNYFKKNYKHMTKEQVIYIFGNPIISDSFDDAYHYFFCKNNQKKICEQKVLNIFFEKNKIRSFSVQ